MMVGGWVSHRILHLVRMVCGWSLTSDCVCIFDSQDQLMRRFGFSRNGGNGQFNNPHGLAFDANNHLYVADHYTHRIQKFDVNGGFLLQFGKCGSGDMWIW